MRAGVLRLEVAALAEPIFDCDREVLASLQVGLAHAFELKRPRVMSLARRRSRIGSRLEASGASEGPMAFS